MKSLQETKGIWAEVLQRVRCDKLPTNKSLLILGDNGSGKTTLVAKLAGLDNPKKGSGLEYNFIEIRDEYREESIKLGAWILDGDLKHVDLLRFAQEDSNFQLSCCLLVASMAEPWNIMKSLEKWSTVLDNFTQKINIESRLNLVVVITKTDHISTLEKEYDYTEETFDFIQQAIRKFCLQHNASLFFLSSKVNKNCDLLHKYLAHIIYDLPFDAPASVVDRDAIFVPAGWDNEKKISILYDNIKSANPDDNYDDFITGREDTGPTQRDLDVEAESDQDFLMRMQNDLGKLPNAPARQPIDAQPSGEGVLQNFFNSLLSKSRP